MGRFLEEGFGSGGLYWNMTEEPMCFDHDGLSHAIVHVAERPKGCPPLPRSHAANGPDMDTNPSSLAGLADIVSLLHSGQQT